MQVLWNVALLHLRSNILQNTLKGCSSLARLKALCLQNCCLGFISDTNDSLDSNIPTMYLCRYTVDMFYTKNTNMLK